LRSCAVVGAVYLILNQQAGAVTGPAVRQFCSDYEKLAEERSLPLVVRQCELQRSSGSRALVVSVDDPVKILSGRDPLPKNGDEVGELTLYGPLRAYRDAVSPRVKKLLPGLRHLILSYRDPVQTVFAIKPKTRRQYIAGELDDETFANAISITALDR
jgi:hypothetical protein